MATIPGVAARGGPEAVYDWWPYGGLVRDVWLTSTGPAWVGRQSIRTEQGGGAGARVHDRIFLGSTLARGAGVTLQVTAFGPDNQVVARQVRRVVLDQGSSDVDVTLAVAHPQLWDLDHPNLYRLSVELQGAHAVVLDDDVARL